MINQREPHDQHKRVTNQKWGPILAMKKSVRVSDDGRTMLQKAQDLKEKQNLQLMKGKSNLPTVHTSPGHLSSIAADLGISSRDGYPLDINMLDNMVSLDKSRAENYKNICAEKKSVKEVNTADSSSIDEGDVHNDPSSIVGGYPDNFTYIEIESDDQSVYAERKGRGKPKSRGIRRYKKNRKR